MHSKTPLRPSRRLGGALLALGLWVALAAPANAAPRGEGSIFASAWHLLSTLWAEIGFVVDPNGQPAEVGFEVDPNGRNQPEMLFGQTGLEADPSGLAVPVPPLSNTGLVFDPNG